MTGQHDHGRVLLLLGTSTGGVGRHVAALATGLAEAGVSVAVAGPADTAARFGFGGTGATVVAVDIAAGLRPLRDLRAVLGIRGLLPEVTHAHGVRAGALAVLASWLRRGRPAVVVTLHNAPPAGGPASLVYRVLERIVARGARVVLVVSPDLGERVRAVGARSVVAALVPAPAGRPPQRSPEQVRAELELGPRTRLLVTVARLAPQKGLSVLADALAVLGRDRPDLDLLAVVAGDGPEGEAMAADIRSRNLPLRLLGHRRDATDLLAAADVVVLPSRWEGQPLVAQEALRCGAALVATDAGGTALVTEDAAMLVPPGDPRALAEAVAALLDDPGLADGLRRRARDRAARLPGDAAALGQVRAVYAGVRDAAGA